MASLVELAQLNKLPDHQLMDAETLEWLKERAVPGYEEIDTILFSNVDTDLIRSLIPSNEWFTNPEQIDTIHGLRHIIRCLIYVDLLSQRLKVPNTHRLEVLIAISIHDLRRTSDKETDGHGERAADWYMANKDYIKKFLSIDDDVRDDVIFDLIYYHDAPYDIVPLEVLEELHVLLDIVKTADSLDRYRQPKMEWRLNEEYLELKPTQDEKRFAYLLVVESETVFLKDSDNIEAVFKAIESHK